MGIHLDGGLCPNRSFATNGLVGPQADTGAARYSFRLLRCSRKRSWNLKRIVPIGVSTAHKQFDLRLLSNRGPSHAAFALRLNEFAVKMPRCMAQYR